MEDLVLKRTLKLSQSRSIVPSLRFLLQVFSYMLLMSSSRCTLQGRRYHSLSVIKSGDLVACGGFFTRKSCISWRIGQAGWIEFANLRFLYFNSSLLLTISFSQERSYHATVVTQNDTLIIFGGDRSSTTGEIVKSEFPKLYLILLRIKFEDSHRWDPV